MSWIDTDLPQKQCCECFYWCPADNHHYAWQREGRYGVASRCKGCTTELHALLRKLKAAHPKPPPGSLCERCGRPPTTEGTRGRGLQTSLQKPAKPVLHRVVQFRRNAPFSDKALERQARRNPPPG